jgi:hypothetical protein
MYCVIQKKDYNRYVCSIIVLCNSKKGYNMYVCSINCVEQLVNKLSTGGIGVVLHYQSGNVRATAGLQHTSILVFQML